MPDVVESIELELSLLVKISRSSSCHARVRWSLDVDWPFSIFRGANATSRPIDDPLSYLYVSYTVLFLRYE